jgi:hypothetical protein
MFIAYSDHLVTVKNVKLDFLLKMIQFAYWLTLTASAIPHSPRIDVNHAS